MTAPGLRQNFRDSKTLGVRAWGRGRVARSAVFLMLLAVLATLPRAALADDLASMRSSVRGSSSSSSDDDDHDHGGSHRHHHHHSHCDDDDTDFAAELAFFAVSAPWWGPHVMARDDFSYAGYFPGAPYNGVPGYMEIEPYVEGCAHKWGGHFQAEYGSDFEDLSRISGRVLIEHTSRLGFDTQFNYWNEDLGLAGHDQLWTGDANLVFRFAQNRRIAMRSGVGVNWLADEIGGEAGFNFTYGFDYFPCKPLVFSAEIDLGRLGDATLFHGRTTAGVVFGHTEAFIGYDYYDLGASQTNTLITGVGIWF